MARIVLQPEKRKKQLLDLALRLFKERGYDDVSVSEIVSIAGVAQGTFYYYFESKESVLDALVSQLASKMRTQIDDIMITTSNPLEKLLKVYITFFAISKDLGKVVDDIHSEKNALLHQKIENTFGSLLQLYLLQIIIDSNNQGLCNVTYPEKTAIVLTDITRSFHRPGRTGKEREITNRFLVELFERILDTKKGAIESVVSKLMNNESRSD